MKGLSVFSLAGLFFLASCGGGLNGPIGETGANGSGGYSLVVNVTVQTHGSVTCNRTDIFQDTDRDGSYSVGDVYKNGFLTCDGAVGATGLAGANGAQGVQGIQGVQGVAGLSADLTYSIVSIYDPCPLNNGDYDEVIIKLGNGKYLASFSENNNGKNTRLSLIPSGNYVTTDGTNCHFIIP